MSRNATRGTRGAWAGAGRRNVLALGALLLSGVLLPGGPQAPRATLAAPAAAARQPHTPFGPALPVARRLNPGHRVLQSGGIPSN